MKHHHFPRGARLLLIFKNGRRVVDSYIETKRRSVLVMRNEGRVTMEMLRSVSIYRGQ